MRSIRTRAVLVAAVTAFAVPAAVALAADTGAGQAPPAKTEHAKKKTYTVYLTGLVFKPNKLTAKAGDKIRFVWKDGLHNVVTTSGPSKVNSGKPVDTRKPLVVTLKKGKYRFLCEPHKFAGMVLTATVK
ncbi:MAG: plastocyanin/azurin family copper-binding protein [Actinomycetota bacterium]